MENKIVKCDVCGLKTLDLGYCGHCGSEITAPARK